MTFKEAIQYLESFINYEREVHFLYKQSFKLERIQSFLETINNPHRDLKCIHIAGTKGKGSTAAFVAYILRGAGFKTGLYTSPHLSDFRERIRILDRSSEFGVRSSEFEGMISEDELVLLVEKLKPSIEKYNKNSEYGQLSFFEVYTALAFFYFNEQKVDFAVLETGLGGRLDATNVVNPLVCGITPISLEHTHLLGSTLKEIATEKTGIIKQKGQIVISSPQEKEADEVIENRCKEYQAKLYRVSKDINFKMYKSNLKYQIFDVNGIFNKYINLEIKLLGEHQLINAATAIGIIELLRNFDINISKDKIKKGLKETKWPGRFEIIDKAPYIVLDGAQNVASVNALVDTLKQKFDSQKKIIILGVSKDKDIEGICNMLNPIADKFILTRADNPRATDPNILSGFIKKDKIMGISANVGEAMDLARDNASQKEVILVTGSLFVVAEAREICLN